MNLQGIRIVGLPEYVGPLRYEIHGRESRGIARKLIPKVDSIVFRGGIDRAVVYSLVVELAARTDRSRRDPSMLLHLEPALCRFDLFR